jgi:phosphoribosyl-ATP pyrophosphohydrolase/phosphoribosyl-AMP cyclohydrolase
VILQVPKKNLRKAIPINKKKLSNLLKFDRWGLIPAIVQDYEKGNVLMLAFMNKESFLKTLQTGKTCFWSRSRKKLWTKGETSGHIQKVRELYLDCDRDTLLVLVDQKGVACHTGNTSCFFTGILHSKKVKGSDGVRKNFSERGLSILEQVEGVIRDRKRKPKKNSYVSSLFQSGQDRILKKITEEAGELVIGSKNKKRQEIIFETADLWFHCLVVLGLHGIPLSEVYQELKGRFGKTPFKKK